MKILYLPNQYSQQRQREKKRWIYPVHLAMEATYRRNQGHEVYWENGEGIHIYEPEGIPFLNLPRPDRFLTDAFNPKYQNNGNYKYLPGTYIQVANGCWHGKCSFCVEQHNKWEVRPVEDVIEELEEIKALGFREVFDDSGTFPAGKWLEDFMVSLGGCRLNNVIGCNMRMVDVDYNYMRRVGFRMLLFGLESANQHTLDRIDKGTQVEDVRYIIRAAEAGLDCHIAVMFGYPWETDKDAMETLRLVWWLLKKGYAKTAQASLYTVPDTLPKFTQRKYVKRIYDVVWHPQFLMNRLKAIHNKDDLKYLWRQVKQLIRGYYD